MIYEYKYLQIKSVQDIPASIPTTIVKPWWPPKINYFNFCNLCISQVMRMTSGCNVMVNSLFGNETQCVWADMKLA